MSYLIIAIVLAMALAPLARFVPSKAQRKVARLREYAALSGLFVEFRDLPGVADGAKARRHSDTIYYGKRRKARGRGPAKRLAWVFRDGAWTGLSRGSQVPADLAVLPPAVVAASADQDSCGIYWCESGDEAEIDQISAALDGLAAELYR